MQQIGSRLDTREYLFGSRSKLNLSRLAVIHSLVIRALN